MSQGSLLQLLERYGGVRALVLGDVMLDRYVYGSVERISPEAPIPVITIDRSEDMPGGAGNVVRNLAALGARASLIGVVGDDASAASLRLQLGRMPGVQARLVTDGLRATTVKTRYVADGQQVVRADRESRESLTLEMNERLLSEYDAALEETDIVILSDYAKGVLSDAVVHAAISKARERGKSIVVDPKSKSFAKYRGATVLTPNRLELQISSGLPCKTDEEVVAGARRTLADGICDVVVVTRGSEGMSIIKSDGSVTHLRTAARGVFDVSGAGDTVIAALSLGLAAGGSIVDSATVANFAAGIVVGKRGTATASAGEVAANLCPADDHIDHLKLFSLENVLQLARDWRAQGMRIAFTNGCFDLLHPGHVSLLDQARRTGDRLIVGLNSDASTRRLKGSNRPVQGEIARATVLASLKSVDAVVIFPEDTPIRLIEALSPDVLVKGADYSVDNVVGAEVVLGYGGKVVLAELVHGHSTTKTLARVATVK